MYHAIVIEESLADKKVLKNFKIIEDYLKDKKEG